ncbi:MAG: hypothetical protein N2560_03640 [Ignavibacteria bacterium]|nr:hypothetical protein [Ignavibacteria bacterium]
MTHFEVVQTVSNWFKIKPEVEIVSRYSFSFPVPDITVQFVDGTIALIECKPSHASRREYLTGLGQAIAFCRHSEKSYLALPKKEFLELEKWLWPEYVGILAVDYQNVEVIREPIFQPQILVEKENIKRGYAYYRDLKINEIYFILKELVNSSENFTKKQDLDNILWTSLTKIRKWKSSKQSNILNTKLLIRDLKLFDFSLNRVSNLGKELLSINSEDFEKLKEFFRKLFLLEGNYIDIVGIIQMLNDKYDVFESVNHFDRLLSEEIIKEKLATKNTNIIRDLRDIRRILKELDILSSWKKIDNRVGKFTINWNKIIHFIKLRYIAIEILILKIIF